jgi:hypothetical protein
MKIKSFSDLQPGDVFQMTWPDTNHVLYYAVLTNAFANHTYAITIVNYDDFPAWNGYAFLVVDSDLGYHFDAEVIGSTK